MPASRATASIETAWKPLRATIAFAASSSCSRRCAADIRPEPVSIRVAIPRARLHIRKLRERKLSSSRPETQGDRPTMSAIDAPPAHHDGVVVGAGFSGLAMAHRLLQDGRTDFVVLEKGDDVGGTWRDNSYPGCDCDAPSHLYSLSFAPNPEWSQTFSPQPEIVRCLRDVPDRHGIRPYPRFGCEVQSSAWDAEA